MVNAEGKPPVIIDGEYELIACTIVKDTLGLRSVSPRTHARPPTNGTLSACNRFAHREFSGPVYIHRCYLFPTILCLHALFVSLFTFSITSHRVNLPAIWRWYGQIDVGLYSQGTVFCNLSLIIAVSSQSPP